MRIVITGAGGNVGTALLRRLARCDETHDIVGIVRRPPAPLDVYRSVRWHSIDVAEPTAGDELATAFDGADSVVHLAWGFQPTHDTEYLRRVAIGGTAAVVDAAHRAGVGQLVHMSSVGTYAAGSYGRRVDESWPTTGISSSPYSRHKSAVEAFLTEYQQHYGDAAVRIARVRPGFILQASAASGLLRYALPGYLPMCLVPLLPLLPMDRSLCIPVVHADDVADAVVRVIERQPTGAFNVAGEPPVGRDQVARALGARPVHVPSAVLGGIVDATWRLRLQPVDRGWLDMAFSVPLLDCARARTDLEWSPQWSATDALADLLTGVAHHAHTSSPPLRPRSVIDLVRRSFTDGLISSRHLP